MVSVVFSNNGGSAPVGFSLGESMGPRLEFTRPSGAQFVFGPREKAPRSLHVRIVALFILVKNGFKHLESTTRGATIAANSL